MAKSAKHKQRWILLLIIAVSLVYGVLNFNILLHTGGDNARYIMLGRSIMEGKFMREINTVDQNIHTAYPPLYPMILSFLMTVFGKENFFMLKLFSLLYYIFSVMVFYLLAKTYFQKDPIILYVLTALYLFCYNIVYWSSYILTESFFNLIVLGILYFFRMYDLSKNKKYFIFLLILSTLSVYVRSNGVIVFVALGVYLLIKREYKNLGFAFIAGILSQVWGAYLYLSTGQGSIYFKQILLKNWYLPHLGTITVRSMLERLVFNSMAYFTTIIPKTYSVYMNLSWEYVPFVVISFLVIVVGLVVLFKRKMFFESLYFLFNLLLLLVWPENFTTDRFFAPFVSLFLINTGIVFLLLKKVSFLYYISLLFLLISIAMNISFAAQDFPRQIYMMSETDFNFRHDNRFRPEAGIRTYFDCANWAKDSLPEDAVIMAMKPELFYIHANKKTEIFPYTDDENAIKDIIKKKGITHIIYENTSNKNRLANHTINSFIFSNKENFEISYTITERPYYVLIKIIKPFE